MDEKRLENLIVPSKILDELFFDTRTLKLLIETAQWNKLLSVLQNYKSELLDLRQRVLFLEQQTQEAAKKEAGEKK